MTKERDGKTNIKCKEQTLRLNEYECKQQTKQRTKSLHLALFSVSSFLCRGTEENIWELRLFFSLFYLFLHISISYIPFLSPYFLHSVSYILLPSPYLFSFYFLISFLSPYYVFFLFPIFFFLLPILFFLFPILFFFLPILFSLFPIFFLYLLVYWLSYYAFSSEAEVILQSGWTAALTCPRTSTGQQEPILYKSPESEPMKGWAG